MAKKPSKSEFVPVELVNKAGNSVVAVSAAHAVELRFNGYADKAAAPAPKAPKTDA